MQPYPYRCAWRIRGAGQIVARQAHPEPRELPRGQFSLCVQLDVGLETWRAGCYVSICCEDVGRCSRVLGGKKMRLP